MRYIYIIFYLSLFAVPVSAQKYYKDLVTDKVTVNSTDQTVTAYIHPVKGDVKAESGKNYYWYSANQVKRTQGGFSGKLLNGPYTAFYLNKNLKEEGVFKEGLQHGEWKSWHENGQLKEIVKWRSGRKTGRFKEFNEQGKISKSGRYAKGELQGKITTYTGKDSMQVMNYKDGNPVVKTKKYTGSKLKSKVKRITDRVLKKKEKEVNTVKEPEEKKDNKTKEKKTKEKKTESIPRP